MAWRKALKCCFPERSAFSDFCKKGCSSRYHTGISSLVISCIYCVFYLKNHLNDFEMSVYFVYLMSQALMLRIFLFLNVYFDKLKTPNYIFLNLLIFI